MRKRPPPITPAALRMRKSRARDADAKKKNGDRLRVFPTWMLDSEVDDLLSRTKLKIPEALTDHEWQRFVAEVIAAAARTSIKE